MGTDPDPRPSIREDEGAIALAVKYLGFACAEAPHQPKPSPVTVCSLLAAIPPVTTSVVGQARRTTIGSHNDNDRMLATTSTARARQSLAFQKPAIRRSFGLVVLQQILWSTTITEKKPSAPAQKGKKEL